MLNTISPIIMSPELLNTTIDKSIDENNSNSIEWLDLGISALHSFIHCNFTGPKITGEIQWFANIVEESSQYLSLEDQCNENAINLPFLYIAKLIFSNDKLQKICETAKWWLIRANYVHQLILEESSNIILNETVKLIEEMNESNLWKVMNCKSIETLFHVEAGQFWLLYKRVNNSDNHLNKAQELCNLNLKLKGAMGKRTHYQQVAKPQLFLNIQKEEDIFQYEICPQLPISVHLNDDLRLERIIFSDEIEKSEIGAFEELIILSRANYIRMSQPKDHLLNEEIVPYLEIVIENTKNWPLKMEALRQRSVLEMTDKRGIERALSQTESLLTQYSQSEPSVLHRTYLVFASGIKPLWVFKQNLADTMLSVGMVKGALDIYLGLRLWEEVIVCYTILELRHKAAEIIRQELTKKPTVKLWCLLGDAEQDPKHYETAWNLSSHKSSRVQRHWGLYYFSKANYVEAIPHLHLSVELNNIQESIWMRLGFAALQVEDWLLASKAYRHYCELEQSSFEAWNNLAKAYIKLGDKSRAFYALQDAVKCNYEKWEVWDNLMVVSIDLGQFFDVIKCYHRILDLKGKHVDIQVLEILTKAITENINDTENATMNKLLNKTLELFGRLTAMIHNDPDLWRLYAELKIFHKTDSNFCQKVVQYLQRAYRAAVSDTKWFQDVSGALKVLNLCQNLASTYLMCSRGSPISLKRSMLGSAKLSLQSVLTKVKQEDLKGNQDIAGELEKLENVFKEIMKEFEIIQAAM